MSFFKLNTWSSTSWLLGLILAMPFVAVILLSVSADSTLFNHLAASVLPDYVFNSIALAICVVLLSCLIGIPAAWLVTFFDFPGRKILHWALMLPLAMPAYVVAFVYTDLLDCASGIQSTLKPYFGLARNECLITIRSLGGASFMLALVLYPYVYLLMRASFLEQSATLLHSAQVLGFGLKKRMLKVTLPLARPALIVAMSLVAMESLADFAVVHYFAVSTLTTGIYDTWLGYNDLPAAARISAIMLIVIFSLIAIEKYARRHQRYHPVNTINQKIARVKLKGLYAGIVSGGLFSLLIAAFALPVVQLIRFALTHYHNSLNSHLIDYSLNSLQVALVVAIFCLVVGFLMSYHQRISHSKTGAIPSKLASSGYAIPGTVMAIAVIIPLSFFDHQINELALALGVKEPGLILSGSIFAIIFAYVVRFSAISVGTLESSFSKLPPSLDMAASSMGLRRRKVLQKIHLPLTQKGLLAAGLLVFIEAMKELPAALLLRPFGFQTLATHVYEFVADEQLESAAVGAIIIVLVGLIPVLLLNRFLDNN